MRQQTIFKRVDDTLIALTDTEMLPYIQGKKRVSAIDGKLVAFTEEQEKERDAEEQIWYREKPIRDLLRIEQFSGMDRGERDIAIMLLPPESERRKRAEEAENKIIKLGLRSQVAKLKLQSNPEGEIKK